VTTFADENGEIQDYDDLRGLAALHPRRCAMLSVFLLSLTGIPPLAGFFAKFGLFQAAFRGGYAELAVIGVIASIISVYYYLRPIIALYASEPAVVCRDVAAQSETLLLVGCAALVFILGVYPTPLLSLVAQIIP